MRVLEIELPDVSDEPKEIAKSMWQFWEYQKYQKTINRNALRGNIDNAIKQNKDSEEEWRKSEDCVGFGGRSTKIYSDQVIDQMKAQLIIAEKELQQTKKYYDFIVNYFIERSL